MDELSIRAVTASDHNDLRGGLIALQEYECALHETRLAASAVADPYLTWMLRQVAEKEGICLIARRSGDFIGFVTGWIEVAENPAETEDSTTFGYISDICILPAWRGQHVSGLLLAAVEHHFAAHSIRRLRISTLAANQPALAAYRSAGFHPYEVTLEKILTTAES